MNWKSQLLKNSYFSPGIKLWNSSHLSQSFVSINVSPFGTAHKTVPHTPAFRNTRSSSQRQILLYLFISFIKWQQLFYCCLKYTIGLKINLCTYILVQMVIVVAYFANYWGLVSPWFQFSTWYYISFHNIRLHYFILILQLFIASSINPSV